MYNLISGLLLADVAISLHESSDCEVPCSFKEFVDTAMGSDAAGTAVAGASVASNGCFLAFGLVHAGALLASAVPGFAGATPLAGVAAFAAAIALCAATQTSKGLGAVTNAAAAVLFVAFAAMLLPGAARVADPAGAFLAPGADPAGLPAAAAAAAPLLLSALSYQNIVPSIAKLLDFDRTKTACAIALGSFLPLLMYAAFSFVVLGGGLDGPAAGGPGAAAFATFSAAALVGSSVAAVMSLAEECESVLAGAAGSADDGDDDGEGCLVRDRFSLSSVALSIAPPTAVALACANGGGHDLTGALHFNGAFIAPLLYGVMPILLHQSIKSGTSDGESGVSFSLPEVLLGAGTVGTLAQEVIQDMPNIDPMNWMA